MKKELTRDLTFKCLMACSVTSSSFLFHSTELITQDHSMPIMVCSEMPLFFISSLLYTMICERENAHTGMDDAGDGQRKTNSNNQMAVNPNTYLHQTQPKIMAPCLTCCTHRSAATQGMGRESSGSTFGLLIKHKITREKLVALPSV